MQSDVSPLPCSDKLVFDSKDEAEASAVAIKYQRGNKLKPYICQYCGLWHLATDYDQ